MWWSGLYRPPAYLAGKHLQRYAQSKWRGHSNVAKYGNHPRNMVGGSCGRALTLLGTSCSKLRGSSASAWLLKDVLLGRVCVQREPNSRVTTHVCSGRPIGRACLYQRFVLYYAGLPQSSVAQQTTCCRFFVPLFCPTLVQLAPLLAAEVRSCVHSGSTTSTGPIGAS